MRLTSNRIALAICLYYVVLGVVYARETPIFEAPDEGAHFLYVHNLLETGQLPVLEDRQTVFRSRSVQRHHPPLYYLVGAALVGWTQRDDVDSYLQRNPFAAVGFVNANNQNVYLHHLAYTGDTATAVWILRLYSLALATATVWVVYRAGQLAFPGRRVGLLAMALVVSMPGFVAIGGSANNDNLITLTFAAGVYWCLRLWRRRAITRFDIAIISLILPAAALSKLTGLALFPIVYGAVVYGAHRRYYTWRAALRLIAMSLLASALLAGWWYVRNWQLYGDPLALRATLRIWGRGFAVPDSIGDLLFEAKGVWDSFWMTLGHFNIRGPEWLYGYAGWITAAGVAGLVVVWLRARARDGMLLLGATFVIVVVALAAATRQINVSQGRILYPGLVAFAPLLAAGWRGLLGQRLAPLLVLPLALVTLTAPTGSLDDAYPRVEAVSSLPADARAVNAQAESLALVGYRLLTKTVEPGGSVRVEVYFSGQHPENPAMFVKALDPVTHDTLGGADFYPGMTPTSEFPPGVLYRAQIDFLLDAEQTQARAPLRLDLVFGWRVPEPEPGRYLPWRDANGAPLDILTAAGPTLVDPDGTPPSVEYAADVTFGEAIRLKGYDLGTQARAGESLPVTLVWDALAPLLTDYTLALGMVNEDGQLVAQADGMPAGYPPSAWQTGIAFDDARTLPIPAQTQPGEYRVYVGWYSLPDVARLPAVGQGVENNLYFLPTRVQIIGE